MTPEQTELWLSIQAQQLTALERIADALERLAPQTGNAVILQTVAEFGVGIFS
jgi:DNA-directed RNA polymerase specialized sigma24 family protein